MLEYKIINLNGLPAAEEILSEKELAEYNSFRIEKRKREWLGGRFAAKSAIMEDWRIGGLEGWKAIEITYDKYGRPIWNSSAFSHKPSAFLLSISHSGEYAVASAKNDGCNFLGIDIEKIEQRHPLWEKDYFHKTEIINNTPEFLTELWTKKEALLKALGLGMKTDVLDIIIGDKITPLPEQAAKPPLRLPAHSGRSGSGVKFLNKALLRYTELNKPVFKIITIKQDKDYILSLVVQEN